MVQNAAEDGVLLRHPLGYSTRIELGEFREFFTDVVINAPGQPPPERAVRWGR